MYLAAVVAAVLVVTGYWTWTTHFSPAAKARRANAQAASAQLREAVLSRRFLLEGGTEGSFVYAMDWHVGAGQLATLVSFDDGTTSLYFSSGGRVIGAGEVESVKAVAAAFRSCFIDIDAHFAAVNDWPAPSPGSYVFYRVDRDATRATAQVTGREIRRSNHPLHALAAAGQRLITAIRRAPRPPPAPGDA